MVVPAALMAVNATVQESTDKDWDLEFQTLTVHAAHVHRALPSEKRGLSSGRWLPVVGGPAAACQQPSARASPSSS